MKSHIHAHIARARFWSPPMTCRTGHPTAGVVKAAVACRLTVCKSAFLSLRISWQMNFKEIKDPAKCRERGPGEIAWRAKDAQVMASCTVTGHLRYDRRRGAGGAVLWWA